MAAIEQEALQNLPDRIKNNIPAALRVKIS